MSPSERKAAPPWDWLKPFWCSARPVSLLCISSLPWVVWFSSSISSSRWSPYDKSHSKTLRLSSDRQDTGSSDIPLRYCHKELLLLTPLSCSIERANSYIPIFFFFAIKLISVQARWERLGQVSGIWKAIPGCFPAAVRPIRLFPDHSPPGLCENYSGVHRWVNTSPTQSDWGPKEIDQNHNKYLFSPNRAERRSDSSFYWAVDWWEWFCRSSLQNEVFVSCCSVCVQPHILLCCLQVMACSFQMAPGGSSTGGSWPRASTMMFWNHTWDWCPILPKTC